MYQPSSKYISPILSVFNQLVKFLHKNSHQFSFWQSVTMEN